MGTEQGSEIPNSPAANKLGTGTEQGSGVLNNSAAYMLEAIARGTGPPTSMSTHEGRSPTPRADHNP